MVIRPLRGNENEAINVIVLFNLAISHCRTSNQLCCVRSFAVSDIVPDPPSNSSFQFEVLLPYASSGFYRENGDSWTSNGPSTWVQLRPEASAGAALAGLDRTPINSSFSRSATFT